MRASLGQCDPPGVRPWHTEGLTSGCRGDSILGEVLMRPEPPRSQATTDSRLQKPTVLTHISPELLSRILDIAEDGIITINQRREIVVFNSGASKLFGYTAEEVVGKPAELLLPGWAR